MEAPSKGEFICGESLAETREEAMREGRDRIWRCEHAFFDGVFLKQSYIPYSMLVSPMYSFCYDNREKNHDRSPGRPS